MKRDATDIQDDLERLDSGDAELKEALERLRRKYKSKGIPYHELMKSKLYGTIKYLLVELQDEHGTVLITDLDTNNTYRFIDGVINAKAIENDRIRNWIEGSKAS